MMDSDSFNDEISQEHWQQRKIWIYQHLLILEQVIVKVHIRLHQN